MTRSTTAVFFTLACALVSGNAIAKGFTVTSDILKSGGTMAMEQVYNSFGCTGGNISPDLKWTGAPEGTQAFAVTMFDPDAPTGSGWWHWLAFNIPADATGLAKGASESGMPSGTVQSRTDFGKPGYGGPCPPPGKPHRYVFRVVALKEKLPLEQDSPGAMVGFYVNQNKLAEAKIEVRYGRKK
jgi:Raf kinase inhibitor-like YbhB/YbcL family protein